MDLRQWWDSLRKRWSRPETLGARGERLAAARYRRAGATILAMNWRAGQDEIDLVALEGRVLVFVEVKARAVGALVTGYYAVDERKKRALRRSVHAYLAALSTPPRTFRFDVVEVTLSGRLPPQVMHYANAPLFPAGYHIARQSSSLGEGAL